MAKQPNPSPPLPVIPLPDPGADLVRWLFPVFIFLILAGFFVLRADGVSAEGNRLTHDRAVFHAVNAATLTGFQLSMHSSQLSMGGKTVLLLLTVAGTLFSLITGGLAIKRILRLEWPDGRIVRVALLMQAAVLVMGIFSPGGRDSSIVGGLVQTAAAFANSGLYVDSAPLASNLFTQVVLLPLAVLGGLGITVIIEIHDAFRKKRPLGRHAQIVLNMTAALFLIAFVLGVVIQLMDLKAVGQNQKETFGAALSRLWPTVLMNAAGNSINCRTAGLALTSASALPRAMVFMTILMMIIGASSAGTGGGLKTTTLHTLFTGARGALHGRAVSRAFGIAAAWLGIYLGCVTFFHMAIVTSEPPMPADRVLFLTISALSNVGLSHDTLSMVGPSLYLLCAAMFLGKMLPLLVLWWMADTVKDSDVAVG